MIGVSLPDTHREMPLKRVIYLISVNSSYKRVNSTVFRASLGSAFSQKQYTQNSAYAKQAYFGVVYFITLHLETKMRLLLLGEKQIRHALE